MKNEAILGKTKQKIQKYAPKELDREEEKLPQQEVKYSSTGRYETLASLFSLENDFFYRNKECIIRERYRHLMMALR